jgi:hypothetical protein
MVHTLDRLSSTAARVEGVRAGDVQAGDALIIHTRNSVYVLHVNGDGTFNAEGGWFARERQRGERVRVVGCTFGGTVLLTRMLAAPGMFLEFDNHVRTTRIREVQHVRPAVPDTIH